MVISLQFITLDLFPLFVLNKKIQYFHAYGNSESTEISLAQALQRRILSIVIGALQKRVRVVQTC